MKVYTFSKLYKKGIYFVLFLSFAVLVFVTIIGVSSYKTTHWSWDTYFLVFGLSVLFLIGTIYLASCLPQFNNKFVVTEKDIRIIRPNGSSASIRWEEIKRIYIYQNFGTFEILSQDPKNWIRVPTTIENYNELVLEVFGNLEKLYSGNLEEIRKITGGKTPPTPTEQFRNELNKIQKRNS